MKRKIAMVLSLALAAGAFAGCDSEKVLETSVESTEETSETTEEETTTSAESEETSEATEEETATTAESEETEYEVELVIDIDSLNVPNYECNKKCAPIDLIFNDEYSIEYVLFDQSVDEDLKAIEAESTGAIEGTYTYNYENGNLIYEKRENITDFRLHENQYTYEGDKLIELMALDGAPGGSRSDVLRLYEYTYEDDLLVKVTAYNQGTEEFSYEFTYKNGWLVMVTEEFEQYWFSYDDNGNLTRYIKQYIDSDYQDAYQIEYTYDENGNLLSETESVYNPVAEKFEFSSAFEYEYDEAGNLIRYDTPMVSIEYTYDDKGNLLIKTVLDDGSVDRQATYEYEFDDEGRITKKVEDEIYYWSEDPWTITTTWTYTYE